MANPFHGETAQMNKSSGSGTKPPKGAGISSGPLKMKLKGFPGLPGKAGPNRNTTGVKKIKSNPQDKGL